MRVGGGRVGQELRLGVGSGSGSVSGVASGSGSATGVATGEAACTEFGAGRLADASLDVVLDEWEVDPEAESSAAGTIEFELTNAGETEFVVEG